MAVGTTTHSLCAAFRLTPLALRDRRGETDLSTEKPLTSSELAALLEKSAEDVVLRARQLDAWCDVFRCHFRCDTSLNLFSACRGFGIDPPTWLEARISLSKMLIVKLWWRTLRDADRKDCSFSGTVSRVCKRLFVVRSGVEQDVDAFFRALANKLQTKVNMRDVEKAQKVFRSHNIPLGANIRLGQLVSSARPPSG